MYLRFYGLRELPFELTANSRYLFLTARQREALSTLQYGLMSSKSLTLLIGEAGMGKTTLLHAALESDRCRSVHCVYLNNPMLTAPDFVTWLARRFELGAAAETAKSVMLERLEAKLRETRARGEVTALVVDEAQALSTDLLEEIRLLANIETPQEKLLPLILAGQPELGERLERTELRQLKQRVTLRCELTPFDLEDTAAYVSSRIVTAGGVPSNLFTREAVKAIHVGSSGIPRTISVICDNALLSGMALGRTPVDSVMVKDVCRDLKLGASAASGEEAVPVAVSSSSVSAPVEIEVIDHPREDVGYASQEPLADAARSRFGFRWRAGGPTQPSTRITG